MGLIENFNILYPYYQSVHITGDCVIEEKENATKPKCFQKLIITGFDGWQIHRDFPKDASSFYQKSQQGAVTKKCHDVLRLDCDDLLYKESEDEITIYCCELKSSYNSEDIAKAQMQIIGSFIKLQAQLSILKDYSCKQIKFCGVIIAYEADTERMNTLLKQADDPKNDFSLRLYTKEKLLISSSRLCRFLTPLNCPDLNMKLVKVPMDIPQYKLDFTTIQ